MSQLSSANGTHRRATHRICPPPSPNGAEGRSTTAAQPLNNGEFNGHDSKGRFVKGNAGGRGRPANAFARQGAALRGVVAAVVNEAEVRVIAEALLEKARDGDVAAAKLLWAYAIGRPGAPADPDSIDLDELRLYEKAIEAMLHLPSMVNALSPDVACDILRTARPLITADTAQQLAEGLKSGSIEGLGG
jgi:hypothetical protein